MPFGESYSKPFGKTERGNVYYVCEAEMCREEAKLHAEAPCVLKKAIEPICPVRRSHPPICSTRPKHKITPAARYELFEVNSQCVKNSDGRCPLLVFTVQFAKAINAYFWEE